MSSVSQHRQHQFGGHEQHNDMYARTTSVAVWGRSGAMQFVLIEVCRSISIMKGQSLGRATMSFWVGCALSLLFARSLACALANWVDSGMDRTFHGASECESEQFKIHCPASARVSPGMRAPLLPTPLLTLRLSQPQTSEHKFTHASSAGAPTHATTHHSLALSPPPSFPLPIHSFTLACSLTRSYTRDQREGSTHGGLRCRCSPSHGVQASDSWV